MPPSKEIGKAMAAKDMGTAEKLKAEVGELKDFLAHAEEDERRLSKELSDALSTIPNIPLDDVPLGKDESDNVGAAPHWQPAQFLLPAERGILSLARRLDYMDFERAAKLAGARFTVLKGPLARLERALGQFMLDLHTTEHGYTEVMPPLMVRDEAVLWHGAIAEVFRRSFPHDGWPLADPDGGGAAHQSGFAEEIVDMKGCRLRFTAMTPCFRSEAGSAGRDTRGMLRQHQFLKVEMVSITDAESPLPSMSA